MELFETAPVKSEFPLQRHRKKAPEQPVVKFYLTHFEGVNGPNLNARRSLPPAMTYDWETHLLLM